MRQARSQAERDTVTVEIIYAGLTGAVFAGVAMIILSGPVLAGQVHGTARQGWFAAAAFTAAAVFCVRVVGVLRRFERHGRADQPSQPGRTRPDS
jgi:hypothetical protein